MVGFGDYKADLSNTWHLGPVTSCSFPSDLILSLPQPPSPKVARQIPSLLIFAPLPPTQCQGFIF